MMRFDDRRDVRRAAMLALACSVLVWLAPSAVFAQPARLGGMITVAQGSIRYSDVGYDPANNVYLVVSGAGRLFARFVSGDGAVLGNVALIPDVSAGTYAPRVTYSADRGGFLVTWLDFRGDPRENTHIRGRFVKYDTTAGQVVLDSADFFIAAGTGGAGAETAPATAYSTSSKEFLVTWKQFQGGLQNVYAQRVGLDGSRLGGEIPLTFDVHFQDDPAVGYDPVNNSFLVAWQNYTEPRGPGGVQVRRVDAGTGTVYPTVQIFTGMDGYTPDVTYHPGSGKFFVTYFSNRVHYGLFTDANGNATTGPIPVVSGSGSYNAWSVAYNDTSNSFFSVFHGTGAEDFGVEIDSAGIPGTVITTTATGVREGNYNPRVAARSRSAQWMLAVQTSDGKPTSLLTAQVITSATRNPGGGVVDPPPPTPKPPVTDATQIDQVNAPNGSEYFAEGNATSDGTYNFNTYYQLLNTSESLDASVRAYFAKQTDNGSVVLKETTVTVPKKGRTTVDLKALVGNGAWSAVFQSQTIGAPIEAQQSVFWGANLEGSSSESSARGTSATWLFAEGTRVANDFFATFFQLFNPSLSPISIIGEYFTDGSATPVTRTYTLPPSSRFTVFANSIAELAGKDFSTRFRALDGQGFVAQRAMYWGPNYAGGHTSIGVSQSQPTWVFAEGAAFKNFDTYYLILNPNPFDVSVDVAYLTATGFVARPGAPHRQGELEGERAPQQRTRQYRCGGRDVLGDRWVRDRG